jgi:hypothetical protein
MSNEEVLVRANTHRRLTENIALGHTLWRPKYILKTFSRKIEENRTRSQTTFMATHSTSGTSATSQTLPLYSDMQKRARFALCDKYMYAYTLH